jgi:hypothetical protein
MSETRPRWWIDGSEGFIASVKRSGRRLSMGNAESARVCARSRWVASLGWKHNAHLHRVTAIRAADNGLRDRPLGCRRGDLSRWLDLGGVQVE